MWWSLRDLLKKLVHREKPLFRAIASLARGVVMTIVCTGNRRDEELTHIAMSYASWAMYNLLLEHNTNGELIEAAMTRWFSTIHKTTAIEYSEYDSYTGKVSVQDKIDGKEIGSKSQEVIAEGLLDLSILDKAPEIYRGAMAGVKYYDCENEDISRGSMDIEAWHVKIMGLQGGLRARANTKGATVTMPPRKGGTPRRTTTQAVTQRAPLLKKKHPTRPQTKRTREECKQNRHKTATTLCA